MSSKLHQFNPHPPARPARATRDATGPNAIRGITEFLGADDKFGALLPAITRMAELQSACAKHLPPLFTECDVIQFSANQLVLAVATPALATKLKHQLPKLQQSLCELGWQVEQIRIKVQIKSVHQSAPAVKKLVLAATALPALATLVAELENVPRNAALRGALTAMLERHRHQKS